MDYIYYTDGSTRNNGSADAIGAYGFIYLSEEPFEFVRTKKGTTNQRMELMAVISACEHAKDCHLKPFDEVQIYTDSAYIHNCYQQNWYEKWRNNGWINSKKEPVANRDLWEQLIPYFEEPQYSFFKVKGHTGNTDMNDRIDRLVQNASMEANK